MPRPVQAPRGGGHGTGTDGSLCVSLLCVSLAPQGPPAQQPRGHWEAARPLLRPGFSRPFPACRVGQGGCRCVPWPTAPRLLKYHTPAWSPQPRPSAATKAEGAGLEPRASAAKDTACSSQQPPADLTGRSLSVPPSGLRGLWEQDWAQRLPEEERRRKLLVTGRAPCGTPATRGHR